MHVTPQSGFDQIEYVSWPAGYDSQWKLESKKLMQRGEPMSLVEPMTLKSAKELFGLPRQESFYVQPSSVEAQDHGPAVVKDVDPLPSMQANDCRIGGQEEILGPELMKCVPPKLESDSRWWTKSRNQLECPLTQLPISLLPYPPFKLSVTSQKPSPRKLVDGKYLALQFIVNEQYMACGRMLLPSDIKDIDDYIHRCKLGSFRPGKSLALAKKIEMATGPQEQKKAIQELKRFRAAARAELGKLRRIQESRLLQLEADSAGNEKKTSTQRSCSREKRKRNNTFQKVLMEGPSETAKHTAESSQSFHFSSEVIHF